MFLILSLVSNPYFWACNILLFVLVPSIAGMLFGKSKNSSANQMWAYREMGVEITFVLFPFLLYSVAHLLNGSFLRFLLSPELPMAALIVSGIALSSLLKAASKGILRVSGLLVFHLCFLAIFMCCAGLVFWLTLHTDVSHWISVLNSVVVVFAVAFSFAVSAAMHFVSKHPDEVLVQS